MESCQDQTAKVLLIMAAPNMSGLVSAVDFSTVITAILAVSAVFVVVILAVVGADMLKRAILGDKIYYGGKLWDRDVYDDAMSRVEIYRKAGGRLDKESRVSLGNWKSKRARDIAEI